MIVGYQVSHITAGTGIIAYNCSHDEVTSKEYSLIQHRECPNFGNNPIQAELNTNVQLLQKREFTDIHGYAAKVVRTLLILPCESGGQVTKTFTQRVLELTKAEVETIYRDKIWSDNLLNDIESGGGPMGALNFNGTTEKIRNLKGWTDENGACEGRDFYMYDISYTGAVLQGTYEMYLTDGLMTVDIENNWVRTFGGTTCQYAAGHCQDYIYGDIYWSTDFVDPTDCDETTYIVLYEGPALLRRYAETEITESTEVVTVAKDHMAFSLVKTTETLICGQLASKTEHPKLFIIQMQNGLRFFNHKTLHRLDLDLNMYRDSKFIHLE